MVLTTPPEEVVWHDLECGSYRADLPLWLALAGEADEHGEGSAVLDVGAGSGRVALELAGAGHRVTAVDRSSALLAALSEAARGLPVETVLADATDFPPAGPYDLAIVPMQTLQLLAGPQERRSMFACIHPCLRPGALLACAVVTDLEPFDVGDCDGGPRPERTRLGEHVYVSRPVRVTVDSQRIEIERERAIARSGGGGEVSTEQNVVHLQRVDASVLWQEAARAGFAPEPSRFVAETDEHAGSEVVVLRA